MPWSYLTENVLPPLNNLVVPHVRDHGHSQSGGGNGDSEGINGVVATWMPVGGGTQHTSIKEAS
jgi:hypothetical protein